MGISCCILFVVHKKQKIFLWIAGGGVAVFVAGSYILGRLLENSTSFRLRRIIAWLNPEKYADTIEHVIQKGGTPAGMHISIMVKEILDFLQIRPGQKGLDATLAMAAIRVQC